MRNYKNFQYPYTCPEIDKGMSQFREESESIFKSYFEYFLENPQNIEQMCSDVSDEIYTLFEQQFEKIREANTSMRDYAESEITDHLNRIDELENEVDYEQKEKEDFERKVSELEDEIIDLKEEIENLNNELNEAIV
jgi:chromosome segregation ATPase